MKTLKPNFITRKIDLDLDNGKNHGEVITRFPPEPNGFLHIGHAKSIFINFILAKEYNKGPCHLRFDDTNPANEEEMFAKAIKEDIKWLGFDWGKNLFHASDYFNTLYNLAIKLIKKGKAYICDLNAEEMREYRGTLKEAGKNSPFRERSIKENLELFEKMRNRDFAEGTKTLRAKIDMGSPNINMRDPVIYRIKYVSHPCTGDKWCIYPTYTFTHPLSDAIEKITHSICTLEFQDQRPFYDWVVAECEMERTPQQIEFSRLNLTYTITSKRKLKYLVENNLVTGWDDPRMLTIKAMRRRGFTPNSILNFCATIGYSKQESTIDIKELEESIRNDLNVNAPRRNAVLKPLKVTIDDLEEQVLNVPNHPQNHEFGRRDITISNTIYIDQDDFMLEPKPGFKKLNLNGRGRLINGYVIECYDVIYDDNKNIIELKCKYLPETLGGKKPAEGIKPKAMLHWVDANNCVNGEIRLYDRLFNIKNPAICENIEESINHNSLQVLINAKFEKSILNTQAEEKYQFNRIGYFVADKEDFTKENIVFNRIVTLRNVWK